MGKELLCAVIHCIVFRRCHFKDNLLEEQLAQIHLECLTTTLSSLGKCTSGQTEVNKMVTVAFDRLLLDAATEYVPGIAKHLSITAVDACEWMKQGDGSGGVGGAEEVESSAGSGNDAMELNTEMSTTTGFSIKPELLTADSKTLQSVTEQQLGRGNMKGPLTKICADEKKDNLVNMLLVNVHALKRKCSHA